MEARSPLETSQTQNAVQNPHGLSWSSFVKPFWITKAFPSPQGRAWDPKSSLDPAYWSKSQTSLPHLQQKLFSPVLKKRQALMLLQWFVLEMFWKKAYSKIASKFQWEHKPFVMWDNAFNYVCLELYMCKKFSANHWVTKEFQRVQRKR